MNRTDIGTRAIHIRESQDHDSVVSANTIDTFKICLDRFWFDQEIKYNWKADIHTGSRSQVGYFKLRYTVVFNTIGCIAS